LPFWAFSDVRDRFASTYSFSSIGICECLLMALNAYSRLERLLLNERLYSAHRQSFLMGTPRPRPRLLTA
jgi:hypothetical protein